MSVTDVSAVQHFQTSVTEFKLFVSKKKKKKPPSLSLPVIQIFAPEREISADGEIQKADKS